MQQLLQSHNVAIRLFRLLIGLFLYGIAISMMIRANIGASPWDVFSQGVSKTVGLSFGVCTILVSIAVLLLWIPLKQMPGVGTIANAVLVGLFADLGLLWIPQQNQWLLGFAVFLSGLCVLSFATALYIGAGMGPGPRDGLMTGLVRVSGKPVWLIRTGIELTVVILGFLLGGIVGLGTAIFALFVGPLTQLTLKWLQVDLRSKAPKVSNSHRVETASESA